MFPHFVGYDDIRLGMARLIDLVRTVASMPKSPFTFRVAGFFMAIRERGRRVLSKTFSTILPRTPSLSGTRILYRNEFLRLSTPFHRVPYFCAGHLDVFEHQIVYELLLRHRPVIGCRLRPFDPARKRLDPD